MLRDYLLQREVKSVKLINEESENITRMSGYQDSASEKFLRGVLKSAVDHSLSSDCFVIIDSLNYIKGYRYELHCIARTLRTPHCTVWIQCNDTLAKSRALRRKAEHGDAYPDSVYEDLKRRFEAPNEKNRWDTPLFLVDMTCAGVNETSESTSLSTTTATSTLTATEETCDLEARKDSSTSTIFSSSSWRPSSKSSSSQSSFQRKSVSSESLSASDSKEPSQDSEALLSFSGTMASRPETLGELADASFERILHHLTSQPTLLPNNSTVSVPHGSANLLYELDKTSQRIVAQMIHHQASDCAEGAPIIFTEFNRTLELHRPVGQQELQRHRRQFVSLHSKHPPSDTAAIGAKFVDFVASQL